MRYSTIKPNDVANGDGIVVSLWTQGCPHRCKGCHNPETWNLNGGKEFNNKDYYYLLECLTKNGVHRDLSILGGEPLCRENITGVFALCKLIKKEIPNIKIYLWTGYVWEELLQDSYTKYGLTFIDVLIDGRFEEHKKDLSLKMRGSSNQRVINVQKSLKENKIVLIKS